MKYARLGDLLVKSGVISEEQLNDALELQKGSKKRLGSVLIENNIISESNLIEALQLQLGVDYIDLSTAAIAPEMAQVLSRNIARKHSVVPVRMVGDELYLAMADPLNFIAIEEVKAATGKRVVPLISSQAATERAIANLYGNLGAAKAIEDMYSESQSEQQFQQPLGAATLHLGGEDSNSAPTVRLVNSVIERAVTEHASDIHLEPREQEMIVRMRIDGVLRSMLTIPRELQSSVIARIKVMGGMDIAERRLPQDGRANVRVRRSDIDLRISTLPTIYGEKVVVRLLNKSSALLSPDGIGLTGANLDKFINLVTKNANGIILVVGPTGSGKSATMNTIVNMLNNERVNMITLEDPVEYNIPGVNQVQINEKAGLTFASCLRSVLRQDPDIIGVGEIRDGETAEIAMRAAMTGHLLLSTIHTNDAVSSIDRLLDLGIEPYLISSTIKGIISQRLVRRVCPHCRVEYTPDEEEMRQLHIDPAAGPVKFFRGTGCADCFHTGYRGRTAIFEILTFSKEVKQLIYDRAPRAQLLAAIEKGDFIPIADSGRALVLSGVTSADEVIRAVNTTDM